MLPKKLSESEFKARVKARVKALAVVHNIDLNADRCAPKAVPDGTSNRMYVFVYFDPIADILHTIRCRDKDYHQGLFTSNTMHTGICKGDTEDDVINSLWTIYEVWEHLYTK